MTISRLRSRLRTVILHRGVHRIGIDVDTESFPCRLLWRDSFTGESGTLCKFYPPKLTEIVDSALRILRDLKENHPKARIKRKRGPSRPVASFSKAFLLSRELDRRAEEVWKRKAVAT